MCYRYSKELINQAEYRRNEKHGKHTRFGDIIPLARGRLEYNGSAFVLIESEYQNCMDKRSCKLSSDISPNVTALWMVEMIRHRDRSRGHANELKLTVFPVKRTKATDNNNKRETKREQQSASKSFVVRDKDYPKYFVGTGVPAVIETSASSGVIQKRTFDMLSSLTQNTFDNYQFPLHFNYNGNNEELNIGEYFAGAGQDAVGTTAASYHTGLQKYGNSISSTPYHADLFSNHGQQQHIRFPASDAITGPGSEFIDRISTTPLTATHLHHHFYLNRNTIPAFDKEHFYEKHTGNELPGTYNLASLHNLQDRPADHPGYDLQNIKFDIPDQVRPTGGYNHILSGHSQVKFPSGGAAPISYQDHNHHNAFSLNEHVVHQQSPVTNYPQPHIFQFPTPLQIVSPPTHQSSIYFNDHRIPLTTAGGQYYAPNHMFPSVQVHPRHNQPILANVVSSSAPFQGNFQLENHQFSEPDPVYHQQLSVLNQHLYPHLLAHQYPGYANGGIQNHQINSDGLSQTPVHNPGTLDVIPLDNLGNPIKNVNPPKRQPVLVTGTGGYDIPPQKLALEHGHNGSSYDQLENSPSPTGVDFTTGVDIVNYPDSINAQLPAPDQNDDLTVPYVDSTVVASQTSSELVNVPKSTTPRTVTREKPRNPELLRKRKRPSSTSVPNAEVATTTNRPPSTQSPFPPDQIKRLRNRGGYFQPKTPTAKAILKWMPKRTKLRTSNEITSVPDDAIPTEEQTTQTPELASATPSFIIVTPTQQDDDEPMTSISTSISIKVGDNESPSVTKYLAKDVAQQLYNGFLPTIRPGFGGVVDVTQSNLTALNTNSSEVTLFRASDEREEQPTSGTTVEEEQIARTILEHAQSLN